jgi:hypothetical protein
VGSVIDTLFLSATAGAAIFAAICAAMRDEPVRRVGPEPHEDPHDTNESHDPPS